MSLISPKVIQQQLQQWLHPIRLRLVRGEIGRLPQLLWEEERIESAAQGWYKGGTVLLVATNRRLLLVDHKWLDTKIEEFPYNRISTIENDSTLWAGKLMVYMPGTTLTVNYINTHNLRHFCQVVMEHIAEPSKIQSNDDTPVPEVYLKPSIESEAQIREKMDYHFPHLPAQ